MTDNTLSSAMRAASRALDAELSFEHLGATSINAVLEGMTTLHGRSRLTAADFKAYRIIHRALQSLPEAEVTDTDALVAPAQAPVPSALTKMEEAGREPTPAQAQESSVTFHG